jgi:hypothetical protein
LEIKRSTNKKRGKNNKKIEMKKVSLINIEYSITVIKERLIS